MDHRLDVEVHVSELCGLDKAVKSFYDTFQIDFWNIPFVRFLDDQQLFMSGDEDPKFYGAESRVSWPGGCAAIVVIEVFIGGAHEPVLGRWHLDIFSRAIN